MKLYFWNAMNNFGDGLSPLLIEKLSGIRMDHAYPDKADFVAVGSLFCDGSWTRYSLKRGDTIRDFVRYLIRRRHTRLSPAKIWGAGIMLHPRKRKPYLPLRSLEIYALRGKLTQKILSEIGACKADQKIAYGDPGLLYPILLDKLPEKVYDVAVIPHYKDAESGRELHRQLVARGVNAVFVDVTNQDPLMPVRQIAASRTVLSSSMHGLIVADGFHIPNIRLALSTYDLSQEEADLKFRDYYSAYDLGLPQQWTSQDVLDAGPDLIEKIRAAYTIPAERVEQVKSDLLVAFPFPKVADD